MTYTIHNIDCIEWMKTQPDNSVDVIITSPPYNFDMPYGEYSDNRIDYKQWTELWITEAGRILSHSGRFIINIQPNFSKKEPYHHWIYNAMMKNSMLWYGERIWEKNNINGYRGAMGSVGLPSKPYMWYSTEYVQIFCKNSEHKPCKREDALITTAEQVEWMRNHIWSIAPARQKDHPAQMPVELADRLIKLFAQRNDIIYDPFCGAGTTILAAERLGVTSIGTELDANYCNLIEQRLDNAR